MHQFSLSKIVVVRCCCLLLVAVDLEAWVIQGWHCCRCAHLPTMTVLQVWKKKWLLEARNQGIELESVDVATVSEKCVVGHRPHTICCVAQMNAFWWMQCFSFKVQNFCCAANTRHERVSKSQIFVAQQTQDMNENKTQRTWMELCEPEDPSAPFKAQKTQWQLFSLKS